MAVGFIGKITLMIGLALMLAGAGSLFLNLDADKRSELYAYGIENPWNATKEVAMVGIGYDITTPTWIHERIGDPEKKTWLIEDIPFPDSRDLLFLVPYWFIAFIIVKFMFKSKSISNWWAFSFAIFFFTIGTVIMWAVWKTIWFYLMTKGAESMGILEETLQARINVSGKAEKGTIWLLIITLTNGIILFKALWPSKGGDS